MLPPPPPPPPPRRRRPEMPSSPTQSQEMSELHLKIHKGALTCMFCLHPLYDAVLRPCSFMCDGGHIYCHRCTQRHKKKCSSLCIFLEKITAQMKVKCNLCDSGYMPYRKFVGHLCDPPVHPELVDRQLYSDFELGDCTLDPNLLVCSECNHLLQLPIFMHVYDKSLVCGACYGNDIGIYIHHKELEYIVQRISVKCMACEEYLPFCALALHQVDDCPFKHKLQKIAPSSSARKNLCGKNKQKASYELGKMDKHIVQGDVVGNDDDSSDDNIGTNILLSADEHWIGRTVDEDHFQISHPQISGKHCKIYKDTNCNDPVPVFLKDTSSNGTRINFKKAQKNSPLVKLKDGDIISFTWPPHNDDSYVFVYREFNAFSSVENGAAIHKRKPEGGDSGNKRLKGLDIGSPDGPDDIRSLGKSKAHLREQLEAHVTTIETLRDQIKMAQVQHGKELEELRETASSAYLDETKTLRLALEEKQKQLDSLGTSNTGLQNYIKDLEEKLSASKQSISRKKAIIHDLGRQLSEEMKLRMEHEKAAQDLKSALHKVQYEEEEIKRQTESYLIRLPREQTEAISKLKQDAQDNVVTFDIKKEVEELTLPLDRKPKQFDWVSELDRESQVTIKHHWEKLGASNKSKAEDGKTISRSKCLQAEGKNIYAAGTTRQELEAEGDCVLQLVVHDLNRA